jgi:diaminopimelate decarboxylase
VDHFERRDGRLFAEQVDLATVADRAGTPTYVYSTATLVAHVQRLRKAWAPLAPEIHYAVKACSNLAILRVLAAEGVAFDVVSVGEIHRVLAAGGEAGRIDFAGVGKRRDEIERALEVGIGRFNVESEPELELIDAVARERGVRARVALRVNPDVDAFTHRHITTGRHEDKFGLDFVAARDLAARGAAMSAVDLVGLHVHIGSQIVRVQPYAQAVRLTAELAEELRARFGGFTHLNIGGGFGIHYREDEAPAIPVFADAVMPVLRDRGFVLQMEPGRLIVGNAGVLLTRVLYVKQSGGHRFVICDAAMNDLLRPSLYDAYHRIEPVETRAGQPQVVDIVGPVCESADTFARDRELPPLEAGDLVAIRSAGAYGFAMANNYNSRPRPAEILVQGRRFGVVRERETLDDLLRGENLQPRWLD